MARRGQAGVTSMPVAATGDQSCSTKGKTYEATAGQSLRAENLALTCRHLRTTTSVCIQLQQGGMPGREEHLRASPISHPALKPSHIFYLHLDSLWFNTPRCAETHPKASKNDVMCSNISTKSSSPALWKLFSLPTTCSSFPHHPPARIPS